MAGRPRTPNPKRDARVAAMRKAGRTYAEIGKELGITTTAAWQIATGYDGYARRLAKGNNKGGRKPPAASAEEEGRPVGRASKRKYGNGS